MARVAVIGAGAIGGVMAWALSGAGHDVTLCVRRHLPGLIIEADGDRQEASVRIVTDAGGMSPADWVFLATKAQDSHGAAAWLDRLAGPETVIAVLQNGIDQAERVGAIAGPAKVLPVVVYAPGETLSPGHVRVHGRQRLLVPEGPLGARFVGLFLATRVEASQARDFATVAWRKLLANISANPITALTLNRIGIMADPDIQGLARALLSEAMAVARAEGAMIQESEIEDLLNSYCHLDPDGGTSMLYDRLAGRAMEHEYLTGALVRAAERHGIEVPFNRAVLALMRGLDRSIQGTAG